jgi:hypothetical protein
VLPDFLLQLLVKTTLVTVESLWSVCDCLCLMFGVCAFGICKIIISRAFLVLNWGAF